MKSMATRKKFEIINSDPPYQPPERAEPAFKTVAGLSSDWERGCGESHRLYFTREAMSHVGGHIGWGRMTQHNCIEQGGILLGQAFRDSSSGVTYGVVSAAVAGISARGSSAHLEMTHDTWKEMLDSADELLEQSTQRELQIIGWYHTHPNGLQVFMSGTDRDTQSRMFAHDWQFAVVLNPQKRCWRAFFGRDAQECKGYVIADDEHEGVEALSPPVTPPDPQVTGHASGAETVETEAVRAGGRPQASRGLRRYLQAWAMPHPLPQAYILLLLLILLLQCSIVVLQVIDLLTG